MEVGQADRRRPDEDHDPRDHQGCYVFSTGSGLHEENSSHSAKRRRITRIPEESQTPSSHGNNCFVPLLNGEEDPKFVKLRYATYQRLWSIQEDRIAIILQSVNANAVHDVTAFVQEASPSRYDGKIPAALIIAGPSIASHGLLFQQLAARIRREDGSHVVILNSTEAPNLKTVLKTLIRAVTGRNDGRDEDDRTDEARGRSQKPLNYDLNILHDFVRRSHAQKIVVAFQDSEAFDGSLLVELVCLFRCWLDRVPFVLLFGIATSVEIFQLKLSRAAIQCIQGDQFDVEPAEASLERVFNDAIGRSSVLRLGPSLTNMLLERHRDHVQSLQEFVNALRYSYMSHFYANPLSVILAQDPEKLETLQSFHCEAIRTLPSFRKLVEETFASGGPQSVRELLEDDIYLLQTVLEHKKVCRDATLNLLDAISVLQAAYSCIPSKATPPRSELYAKGVGGELHDGVMVRELLLSVKKLSSDVLVKLLHQIMSLDVQSSTLTDEVSAIRKDLDTLTESRDSSDDPFRSEHDLRHETLRTTIVAQKVEISKQRSSLSEKDSAYSKIVHRTHKCLQRYFTTSLVSPQSLFLHEVFFYDLKSPHRDVFTPKQRHAVERALATPHDYLGCTCCGENAEGLSSTQPATAILYQLYLESGALINVFDLWSAFYAIVGGENGEDCDEANAMALFYRALADLKYLGTIKHSRKKTDHITKLAWKGL